MIKAAIAGADTVAAGQLIRILVNHPDVHLTAAEAPALTGQRVDHHHYGLIGDTDLTFSSDIDLTKTDALFVAGNTPYADVPLEQYPDLRIIDLTNGIHGPEYVSGIPELHRKEMVRGARAARIPGQSVTLIATALLPLAKNLLLRGKITARGSFTSPTPRDTADILRALTTLQNSLAADLDAQGSDSPDPRYAYARITLDCAVDADHLESLYREFFDDHNMTHLIHRCPEPLDVRHTAKTLIHLDSRDGTLTVSVAHDPQRRAAAAAAVHCFNLLFGLHERTAIAPLR